MKLCWLAVFGLVVSGCQSSDEPKQEERKSPPPKPPAVATLYVETKGEPVNAGGKATETADDTGKSTGAFKPGDLLVPGMFLLVSTGIGAGGALLIRALDKKDAPAASSPAWIAGGGSDGTYVSVPTPADAASATPAPTSAPAPGTFSAVASKGDKASPSAPLVATGKGVVSTPTSIVLDLGYPAGFTGPSWVSVTTPGVSAGEAWGRPVLIYEWTLSVDTTRAPRGDLVSVYANFTGLEPGVRVVLLILIPGVEEFTLANPDLVWPVPDGSLGKKWGYRRWVKTPAQWGWEIILDYDGTPGPLKLGQFKINEATTVTGSSFALTKS